MRPGVRRAAAALLAVVTLAATTSACGFHGLYSANLPGSVGGPFTTTRTYDVTVYFDDVLDLVPQSAVKVNDVTVGTVESVSLVDDHGTYRARVRCLVKSSVDLPANTTALLEETSLLGEKYVELVNPQTGGTGSLRDTKVIGEYPNTSATAAYPEVEQVFGVLSTILNGGGLEKLQNINTEVSAALAGRESSTRDLIVQLNTIVGGLNQVRGQIVGAITATDSLVTELNRQNATIATALDDIGPGLAVLADQRANLVSLLQGLSRLGVVGNRVINESLGATRNDLALLQPVLTQLNKAGAALPGALELALDYPFPQNVSSGIKGDSANLVLTVDLAQVLTNLLGTVCAKTGNAPLTQACTNLVAVLGPLLKNVPGLPPGLLGLLGGLGGIGGLAPSALSSAKSDGSLRGLLMEGVA